MAEADARAAQQQLHPLGDELLSAEQARIVALLIEQIEIRNKGLKVCLRTDDLFTLAKEMTTDLGEAACDLPPFRWTPE